MVKNIFIVLLSSGLFVLLSCTNSPAVKQLESKADVSTITHQPAVKSQIDIPLNRKTVLSGKATMLIPEGFELMNAEMMASKYSKTGYQPTEVYTNEEGTINIALNYTHNKAEEKDLQGMKTTMEGQFKQPTIEFIQSSLQEINGRKYISMEFITPASDSRIYNLIQITSLEGRLAMFTFNCTENYRKDWQITGKKIMKSIEMK